MDKSKLCEVFIQKAIAIHGNYYNYDRVIYVNNKTNVTLVCPIHGEFSIRPDSHIGQQQGCKPCGIARFAERNKKHGYASHPLYGTWKMMMQRCYTSSHKEFIRYGLKGIIVCDDFKSPDKFIQYIESLDGYSDRDLKNLTLDRIDVYGNYEYGNLRWATKLEQACNKKDKKRGYYGINLANGRWRAVITLNNKRIYTSYHDTQLEALHARNEYIKAHNLPHKIQEV